MYTKCLMCTKCQALTETFTYDLRMFNCIRKKLQYEHFLLEQSLKQRARPRVLKSFPQYHIVFSIKTENRLFCFNRSLFFLSKFSGV